MYHTGECVHIRNDGLLMLRARPQNGLLPFSKTDFVIAWLFRECSALLVFVRALFNPDIKWRTGTYRLRWGGYAEEVKVHSTFDEKQLRSS